MTIVNPKSISGINSITTGSGSDNLLTIHTSDASSTERVRINSSGDVIVGSGITVSPDGDIFATGVTTATTFSGSGANLTNLPAANITGTLPAISGANLTSLPAQATIANNADNRVITGGSGVNLNGEENLTWDGSTLTADKGSSNGSVLQLKNDDDTAYSSAAEGHLNSILSLESTTPAGNNDQSVGIQFYLNLTGQTGSIQEIGAVRTGNGAGALVFRTRNSSSGRVERLRIASDGDVTISDGDLVIGTAGHGINFAATSDASGASSELLDDYEEGTFSVAYSGDSGAGSYGYSRDSGLYTKIGNKVYYSFYITINAINSNASGNTVVTGLPFTSGDGQNFYQGGYIGYYSNWNGVTPSNALVDKDNTRVYIYKNNTTTSITHSVPTDLTTSSSLIVSGHYHVA